MISEMKHGTAKKKLHEEILSITRVDITDQELEKIVKVIKKYFLTERRSHEDYVKAWERCRSLRGRLEYVAAAFSEDMRKMELAHGGPPASKRRSHARGPQGPGAQQQPPAQPPENAQELADPDPNQTYVERSYLDVDHGQEAAVPLAHHPRGGGDVRAGAAGERRRHELLGPHVRTPGPRRGRPVDP